MTLTHNLRLNTELDNVQEWFKYFLLSFSFVVIVAKSSILRVYNLFNDQLF